MGFRLIDIEAMIDSYAAYLRVTYPRNGERFDLNRIVDREAAMAEAITFGILESLALSPEVNESVTTGGADFICTGSFASPVLRRFVRPPTGNRFFVEATSLLPDAVTNRSGIPKEIPESISGGFFSLLTQSVNNKAKDKNEQLEGCRMPAVVAIASSHQGMSALFNALPAEYCLVSDPQIRTPVGGGETRQETNLQRALFLHPGPDPRMIVSYRQNISAVLLIAVSGEQSEMFGILHPEPAFPLNIKFFPKVPFIRVQKWPITDGVISTEWVVFDPNGLRVPHLPIKLPTATS